MHPGQAPALAVAGTLVRVASADAHQFAAPHRNRTPVYSRAVPHAALEAVPQCYTHCPPVCLPFRTVRHPGDIPGHFTLLTCAVTYRVHVRQPRQHTVAGGSAARANALIRHPAPSGHPSTHHGPRAVRAVRVFGLKSYLFRACQSGAAGVALSGISTPHRASQNDSLRLV